MPASPKFSSAIDIVNRLACGKSGCDCARAAHNGTGATHCPSHVDPNPSLSVTDLDGQVLIHCHASCQPSAVFAALRDRGLWAMPSSTGPKRQARIVATYDYRNAKGELVYQVVRYEPKAFKQRRPDGNGGWSWNLKSVEPILYRLPELMASSIDIPVYIFEGEKDVDQAVTLGLLATCNSGGAGNWTKMATTALTNRPVVIVPDGDEPGRAHAERVMQKLMPVAASVRVVELPVGKDLSEWVELGHTIAELAALVEAAAPPLPPEDGANLLDEVAAFYRRFVRFPSDHALNAIALWTLHTHAIDAAETTPYLRIESPEKESGKTRTLEVAGTLVARPESWMNASPAAIYRLVDEEQPTLLVDELDSVFGPRASEHEDLRALFNSGYRRGARVARIVGEGAGMEVRRFNTFSAKMLCGLGSLPDTLRSRSIVIRMQRRKPTEPIERYRMRDAEPQGHRLRARLSAWATAHVRALRDAVPTIPDKLSDRAGDCWEPLFAIADRAGGAWSQRARDAAIALTGVDPDDEGSLGLRLVRDAVAVLPKDATDVPSASMVAALIALPEAPWGALGRDDKPLTQWTLARLLSPFGVKSKNVKQPDGRTVLKCYPCAALREVADRYPATKAAEAGETEYETATGNSEAVDEKAIATPAATPAVPRNRIDKLTLIDAGSEVAVASGWDGNGTHQPDDAELVSWEDGNLVDDRVFAAVRAAGPPIDDDDYEEEYIA